MTFQEVFQKLITKLSGWFQQLVLILPNLLVAVVVLIIFWLIARLTKRLTFKLLNRFSRSEQVNWLVSVALYVVVQITGVAVALGVVGLDKTVTSVLAGAGLVGLALALAFQDLGQNLLAGIYLALRRTVRPGDIVETKQFFGTVRRINLRSVHIETPTGQIVVVPNKQVFEQPLIKHSTGRRRVDLSVGISYGDDLEKARRVTIDAVNEIEERMRNREVELFYESFADSSINFTIRFWINFATQRDFLAARSEAIMRIRKAFNENNITIPFPIRTLDFGIVGGEKLIDVLQQRGIGTPSPSPERDHHKRG